jgi:hypothetical protein
MATGEQRNYYAKSFLKKPEEYVASAEDNLAAERHPQNTTRRLRRN